MDSSDDQLIPVALCPHCEKQVPVIIDLIDNIPTAPKILKGKGYEVVICPACWSILNNSEEDVEIEWYDAEELEKVGYQIIDDREG